MSFLRNLIAFYAVLLGRDDVAEHARHHTRSH